MKHKALDIELEEELSALKKLRERVNELRYAMDYFDKETTLYYAVDFSEIFSYLHYDEEDDRNIIGVTLDLQDQERRFLQYRLALTHLFNSFADTLYVLPSHTIEMWAYARTQARKKGVTEDQAARLLERTRSLNPDLKVLLDSLKDKAQSPKISHQLLTFVKSSEFGPLCVDVSEFVNSYKRGNVLRNLIANGRISTRTDSILRKHGITFAELKEPSEDEISQVFNKFPPVVKKLRPFSTRVDARAFLFLRNINQLLTRANARMILITRDTHLLEIAQSIGNDSPLGWNDARQSLRGIESIFLDLILTSSPSRESKRRWVLESDLKLATIQDSLQRSLNQIHRDRSYSVSPPLASVGKRVLNDTVQLWDQHINVKLSLASTFMPWLGETFQKISSHDDLPETFKTFRHEYQTLTNLLEYFSTPTYRSVAGQDIEAIWNGIEMDCIRMGLLNILGKEGAERISQIFAQTLTTPSGDSKTILHSKRFFKMPSLQLVSKKYRDKLKLLQTANTDEYEKALVSIIREAVSGFNKPEDFLIIAFLLGLLDEWHQAFEVMEKCRQVIADLPPSSLLDRIIPPEVDYFSSAIKRRLAQMSGDTATEAKLYLDAYDDITNARNAAPDEPRYLVAEAATAMLYHELLKRVGSDAGVSFYPPKILSEAEAKAQSKRALDLLPTDEVRLRAVILNNLAFGAVLADNPSFEEAEFYIRQIDEAIKNADEVQAALLSGVLPHIHETKVMLRARNAVDTNNLGVIKECLHEVSKMAQDADLLEYEKRGFISHIEILNNWIRRIES